MKELPGHLRRRGADPRPGSVVHFSSNATGTVAVDGSIKAGEKGTITIGDGESARSYSYTTQEGDTLASVRDAFVSLINQDPYVEAFAAGVFTRIRLRSRVPGPEGNGIKYSVKMDSEESQLVLTATTPGLCCASEAGSLVTGRQPRAARRDDCSVRDRTGSDEVVGRRQHRPYLRRPGQRAQRVCLLAGRRQDGQRAPGPWFTDAPIRLGDKDAQAVMRGKWVVELAELDSLGRAENSAIKAFFSPYVDRYRAHYERRAADIPRQQVFAGTVNHRQWLRDETGGRRFWTIWCESIALDELRENRDQLWAEAMHLYRHGTKWMVTPEEWELSAEQQDARYVGDAWETRVLRWLRDPGIDGQVNERVTSADVLAEAEK